jgi:hypothetical protein
VQERFSLTPPGGFDCVHVRACVCFVALEGRGRAVGGRRAVAPAAGHCDQSWCCSPIFCVGGWCTVCWGVL